MSGAGSETVWVTGASGFIGQHLARRLSEAGSRVVGFGRREEGSLASGAFVSGDLSTQTLEEAVDAHGVPARVFHFAGGSTVGASFADPLRDFEANVVTTEHVLDVLRRRAPQAAFFLASSAAVYGASHEGPILTTDSPSPSSPYGHHKMMAERAVRFHAEAFGMRAAVLRLFSVYGEGIRKQLIHDICRRVRDGETALTLGGSGAERRDWIHVDDVAQVCVQAEVPAEGSVSVYNVASGAPTPIKEIADILSRELGLTADPVFSGESRSGDPFSLYADPASLPPNFSPQHDVRHGLARYVAWFRSQ